MALACTGCALPNKGRDFAVPLAYKKGKGTGVRRKLECLAVALTTDDRIAAEAKPTRYE